MARKKSASFVGSPVGDTVRDASIFARWIGNAAGDFQLLYDRVTGENAHSSSDTINHSGNGRGCPLALPIVSQQIERNLRIVGTVNQDDFFIILVPVFGAPGTQTHVVEVDTTQFEDDQMTAEVRDGSWALVSGPVVGNRPGGGRAMRFVVTLGQGWQYLAIKKYLRHDDVDPNGYLNGWRMWPEWLAPGESNGLTVTGSTAAGAPYPVQSTLTPATVAPQVIDDAMVAADSPLDPWVLTRLNRLWGTLWEYFTGAPVPGNNATTCATTRDHSQTSFTAEPLPEMPVASVALGCIKERNVTIKSDFVGTIGTGSPIEGPIDWVRYPQTATGAILVSQASMWLPPFANASPASNLDVVVVICDYNTGVIGGNWQARVVNPTSTSGWSTFTRISTTNLWTATIASVGFSAGNENRMQIELQNTVGGSIVGQEIVVLGYGLAFDL